jgi:hypothetical protein
LGTQTSLIFHQSNSSSTPFIDFHFGKDVGDYTARIIQTEANALEVGAGTGSLSFRINGGLRVVESPILAASIYTEVTVMRMLWGLNCSDGNLNVARGSVLAGYQWATLLLTRFEGLSANRAVATISGTRGSFTGIPLHN